MSPICGKWAMSDRLGLLNKILLAITDEKRSEKYGDIDSGNREVSWEGGGHFWWRRVILEVLQEQFLEEAADLWGQQHEAPLCHIAMQQRRLH